MCIGLFLVDDDSLAALHSVKIPRNNVLVWSEDIIAVFFNNDFLFLVRRGLPRRLSDRGFLGLCSAFHFQTLSRFCNGRALLFEHLLFTGLH